ncbi:MAG: Doubled CXXCH motif (Paired CXXCH 1) [Verrucomicrobia bacterium]|nr:MAG: Doubled CXXCH motif (Paired CXXCH 1) [Verrucomicrobiota bacterium]
MTIKNRWSKHTLIFGGTFIWGLLLISCIGVNRAVLAPPKIPGAHYVGTKECAQCHTDQTDHFATASHARLNLADPKVGETGCEACHGPGSVHVAAGGGKGSIVNPGKSPEACFACHLDKKAQFSLPNTHQVLNGKMSCADCHEVHKGNAIAGTGVDLEGQNATCTKCHTEQKGPFVYEHGAMREGCVACHNPHGSINAKMLVARDANLCLRCHLEAGTPGSTGEINANAIRHTTENHNSRLMQGTCWSAGCHEQPHGSNVSFHFRN